MKQARTYPAYDSDLESPEEAFDKLRQCFHERLRSDQARLATLAGALGIAEVDCPKALNDIETFAHRLRGAALVFEFGEIADAARGLELAAAAAIADQRCQRSESTVLAMMQALALLLSQEICRDASNV